MTAGEAFLRTYHDRTSGSLGRGFASYPATDGRTSYEHLADRVAGAGSVLDLGCADGILLAQLARNGVSELAGIDLSEGELALARQRPELRDADLRAGRAQQLPFPDNSFDAVVSHMALMLMAEVDQVVAEAARVLRPSGTFAVTVGIGAAPGGGLDAFLSLARPLFNAAPPDRRVPADGDRRTRTRDGLTELLTPAGFAPVTWDELTLTITGTPEEVWESITASYYDLDSLTEAQIERLREDFVTSTADLSRSGWNTGGARVAMATTRLSADT